MHISCARKPHDHVGADSRVDRQYTTYRHFRQLGHASLHQKENSEAVAKEVL